jgi:hypothetical protein
LFRRAEGAETPPTRRRLLYKAISRGRRRFFLEVVTAVALIGVFWTLIFLFLAYVL